ncbi:S9 family peptidase [Roseiflexus sp.]|uniref:S9 family peptidase n=1 Tax=Roseiflexus sp. TaxID=2562120 RepID=UPI00398A5632
MPGAPVPPKRPRMLALHGDTLVDHYFWMRERDNPEVIAHLEAENRYTEEVMAHTVALRKHLYDEMRSRMKEDDESAAERYGTFEYYTRTRTGQQYPIAYRRAVGSDDEELLLDINALAEGRAFTRIGVFLPTYDGRLLAYSVDIDGSETFTLYFKDLATGTILDQFIPNTYYGAAWSNDGQHLFYTTLDDARRPHRVYRHAIGSDPTDDVLVYEESDPLFHLSLSLTRSRAYILITSHSNTTSEVRVIPADAPQSTPRTLLPRRHRIEYTAHHHDNYFYFLTNEDALNFRVVRAPVDDVHPERLEEVIPHRSDVMIEQIDLFANHMVAHQRAHAQERLEIIDLRSRETHALTFPEQVYTLQPWDRDALWEPNLEFDTAVFRLHMMSLTQPRTIYDYDMDTRTLTLVKRDDIPGYDPAHYRSERLWATADDGTRVPISIVYRTDVTRPAPLLLYGYGSYGATADPRFSIERISLLDRGVIFAIAHVRGGGELGRAWYESGKMMHKRNTFTDFIACAEYLIAEGYTIPERLAIVGRSAGGLLVGAVTTMRPDLMRCVVADVPFVDVVNTMLDSSIPLTAIEFEEWGNPAIAEQYAYMKSYSPYDNTTPHAYPALLATAGLHDPRVQYWEPAKWVAKLREVKTNDAPVLLKTEMSAGHSGPSGRYDRLHETAFEYAFILDQLGIVSEAQP